MSKETREKMGEVARTARALLNVIAKEDLVVDIDNEVVDLRASLKEFEEHLYGTVADVMAREVRAPTNFLDADTPGDPPIVRSADPDDDIPF